MKIQSGMTSDRIASFGGVAAFNSIAQNPLSQIRSPYDSGSRKSIAKRFHNNLEHRKILPSGRIIQKVAVKYGRSIV